MNICTNQHSTKQWILRVEPATLKVKGKFLNHSPPKLLLHILIIITTRELFTNIPWLFISSNKQNITQKAFCKRKENKIIRKNPSDNDVILVIAEPRETFAKIPLLKLPINLPIALFSVSLLN